MLSLHCLWIFCLEVEDHVREWIYAQAPAKASKMADRCANSAAAGILYLCKEAVLRKKHIINQAIQAGGFISE